LVENKTRRMRALIPTLLFLFICSTHSFSQVEIDSSLIKRIAHLADKQEKKFKRELLNEGRVHSVYLDFKTDEYKIEEYINRKLGDYPDSRTYISELLLAEKRYQLLLSKYFNKLIGYVNTETAAEIKETQALWQRFKSSEQKINMSLNPEEFNLEEINLDRLAERHLAITKYRVLDIVEYISRMPEKKEKK